MQKLKTGIYVPVLISAVFCTFLLGIFIGRKTTPYIPYEKPSTESAVVATGSFADVHEKININTATVKELAILDGIGETLAQRIVDYRNENGPFRLIEDIKNVAGIGDTRFKQMADYITVGGNL